MSKIKNFFKNFFDVPSLEIPPEREQEIIEKIAQTSVRWGLEMPTMLIGSGLLAAGTIVSHTVLLPAAPLLEFVGIKGYDYTAFFSKQENVERLLKRIDELRDAREKAGLHWPDGL